MQGRFRNELINSCNSIIDSLIAPTHLLKKVNQSVDFSFVNEFTASCYSPNNGRPSISPELCFRMLLIGYLFSIPTNRRLIEEVKYNISYRWFCGLALDSAVPSHSSLSRFFKRLSFRVFQSFFNAILNQCHQAGLLNTKSVMTDSTLFQANASLNSLMPKSGSEDANQGERGVKLTKRTVSNKTHQSKTDPDASLAFKKGAPCTLKYKAHVCTTSQSRVILDIKITTGAVHDSQPYLEQLNAIKLGLSHNIKEVIADRAYGSGHIISTLKSVGITTYIPLLSTRSGTSQRTITPGFYYDSEKDNYRCPANHELKPGKLLKNDYTLYHFRAAYCQNCALNCQAPKKKNRAIRVIARHTHFDLFQ
ncbi:transposase, partial [Legionella gresilensis]|uniref:transposase n=1 Tax=Legionella gresilensis TaxID=91823 RepID=UPI001A9526CC